MDLAMFVFLHLFSLELRRRFETGGGQVRTTEGNASLENSRTVSDRRLSER